MTTVVNIKNSDYDIYIGRGRCSKTNELSEWGNPFTHIKDGSTLAAYIVPTRQQAIESHYTYLRNRLLTDKFLLERLLLESDNTAYRMLVKNFSDTDINTISEQVGLEALMSQDGKISAKDYTRLLRVLYLASYVDEEHSQFLLTLMQDSEFKNFIRAGLPSEVPYSHKWGTNVGVQVYSDSGIVYVEDRPFMISVMIQAKGDDQKENESKANALMKEIGQKTYEYIKNY